MNDFEKQEFWKGLARLYDNSVAERERMDAMRGRMDTLTGNVERLTGNVEALTRDVDTLRATVGTLHATTETLNATAEIDAENIRALARIAEIHERRLTGLEGN